MDGTTTEFTFGDLGTQTCTDLRSWNTGVSLSLSLFLGVIYLSYSVFKYELTIIGC